LKNKNRVTWTEECFREAVKKSKSLTEVMKTIGIKPIGSNFKTVKKYITLWNLDISHFIADWTTAARAARKIISDEDLFVENSIADSQQVKNRFIKTGVENKCAMCSINSWQGQDLTLQMDHINGYSSDNRLENLRLLCPNCHSLTSTYCGKNRTHKQGKKKYFCQDCSAEIHKNSDRCSPCSHKRRKNAISWPEKEYIFFLIEEYGYLGAARILKCSDNAIRKHLKKIS
jgi:hypothetical protein